ncbi:type II toxin-antitoxin system VapC family toxin [Glycomyces salinus]|uniref:type II toxin-antitoxin system VapC family toxin n=1 Tax=Glycomyces salinus TaxID=980294 RepID=UPI0018ED5C8E|nr:type II toxin-antitoxin system VapC family toxin [Glycomyces salinus]
MIVYADSSVLARAYLPDEQQHDRAQRLLRDPDIQVVTGSWTRIEVSGALVRAARANRGDQAMLLSSWEADTAANGAITVLTAPQAEVERDAFEIVIAYGIRAMDAWHLATASLVVPELAAGEQYAFASRDKEQAEVAAARGFAIL